MEEYLGQSEPRWLFLGLQRGPRQIVQTYCRLCFQLFSETAGRQVVRKRGSPLQILIEHQIYLAVVDILEEEYEEGLPALLHRVHRDQRYEERSAWGGYHIWIYHSTSWQQQHTCWHDSWRLQCSTWDGSRTCTGAWKTLEIFPLEKHCVREVFFAKSQWYWPSGGSWVHPCWGDPWGGTMQLSM